MEIAQGILSRIGEYMVELTVKQGCYLFRFNKIVEDLEEGETKLKSSERRMKEKVEAGVRRTEIIDEDVKTWLNDVRNILDEVQRLKEEIEAKKSCLGGWFPNCGSRYWLSRKAAKKTSIMLKCVDDYGKIETVGRLASLRGIEFSAPEDFEFFQSSKVAFDQIIDALRNDETYLVGLYGMGGSGKTTLATKLGSKVKEERIFDEVAMVVLSQNPDFKDIQSKLASSLGVELKEEDEKERANRLYLRFTGTDTQTKKKILVILDDVWKKFDLKSKIGFPFGVESKHCKILLTTRKKDLCSAMNCQSLIPLGLLNEKEGLTLLKKCAIIADDSITPELKALAIEVAGECKGLPLAITAIGSALKGKGINEWKLVCGKLKDYKLADVYRDLEIDDDQNVYACLQVSYDYLKSEENRFCFLLCSLFPEDYEISVEELVVYGMGLGLFPGTKLIEDARSRLRVMLNRLKDSCLLLDASRERVKMHDMVRDVALWIASKGNNVFMSKSDVGLMEISGDKDLVQHTAIYLRSHKIEELPANLVCPKLELLFVGGYRRFENLLKVSDECFKEMKGLKVLDLENVDLSLKSLEFLTNLKTLKLSNCSLRDISYLEKLNKLEILYLQSFSLDELPRELVELRKLRLLDFDSCGTLVKIPSNLIQRCSQLEELYIYSEWEVEDKSEERSNASLLLELNSLSRLVSLRMRIDATCLPKDFVFPKLLLYNISVNTDIRGIYEASHERSLRISSVEATSLMAFKALYETLEYLYLEKAIGCEYIVPGIDQRGLNLQNLKSLYIDSCERLEYVFPMSMAGSLEQLEHLTIQEVPHLKQVFFLNHGSEEYATERDEEAIMLPILRDLRLVGLESVTSFLPEKYHSTWTAFKRIEISNCSCLTSIFCEFKIKDLKEDIGTQKRCGFRQHIDKRNHGRDRDEFVADMLKLEDLPQLEYLWKGPTHHVNLQSLKSLHVESCERLEHIFPISMAGSLVKLKQLIIRKVDRLKQLFFMDNQSEENVVGRNGKDMMLPKLQELRLIDLESLTSFLPEGYHVSLPALEVMEISKCSNLTASFISQVKMQDQDQNELKNVRISSCDKLQQIFSISAARGLVQLEQLTIENSHQLKQVFSIDDGSEENVTGRNGKDIKLPKLQELRLVRLKSLTNFLPEDYHVSLPALEMLKLSECPNVATFFILQLQNHKLRDLSLQHLVIVRVRNCNKLRHLFSSTLVRNLSQLRELTIEECEDLEQIIFKDDEEDHSQSQEVFGEKHGADVMNDKEIILLPQLETLSLKALPNFTSFCPESYHLKLNLVTLRMEGFQDNQMCFRNLNYLGDVKELWIFDCRVNEIEFGLCKTSTLYIRKCHKLRRIVVPLPTLLQLSQLTIAECGELEDIIIVEDDDEVVIHKDRADDDDDDVTSYHKQLEIPNLKWLLLDELGSLAKFCPVNYHFIFPSLKLLVVRGCGKMETIFSYSRDKNERVDVHAEAATKPLNEGSNHDQDTELPPPEPTLDIECHRSNFASKLPPYFEKDDKQRIDQQSKINAHGC